MIFVTLNPHQQEVEIIISSLSLMIVVSIYLIISKDEVLDTFKTYKAEVENQLNMKKKKSDGGEEYKATEFANFCAQYGIIPQTTTPYTLQQNDVVERKKN